MTEINNDGYKLDHTMAGMIAKELDVKDQADGIDASIWNKFVEGKGGKNINNCISTVNAMKSISTYLVRKAKETGKAINDLAQEWLAQAKGLAEVAAGASRPRGAKGASTSASAKSTAAQAPSMITVPDGVSDKENVQKVVDGATGFLHELKNMNPKPEIEILHSLDGVPVAKIHLPDPDNRWINVLYDNDGNITTVYISHDTEPDHCSDGTTSDCAELSIVKDKIQYNTDKSNSVYEGNFGIDNATFSEVTRLVKELVGKDVPSMLIKVPDSVPQDKRKDAQEVTDGAMSFLNNIANMNPKPEIKTGTTNDGVPWAQIKLPDPDNRWINVYYDNDGNITKVAISHDTEPNHKSDGTTFDGAELSIFKDKIKYDTDKSNDEYEGNYPINDATFNNITSVVEKIFGNHITRQVLKRPTVTKVNASGDKELVIKSSSNVSDANKLRISNACEFLDKVVNMSSRPEIVTKEKDGGRSKEMHFEDGTYIYVGYSKNGQMNVTVQYGATKSERIWTSGNFCFHTDEKNNSKVIGDVDVEGLKNVIKMIFGEDS